MNLSDIQQYSHKIIKIDITNNNKKTSYNYTTIKINFGQLNKETNEIIRFSTTENPKPTEWLEHQSAENDYFLRIPNVLNSVTHIYAHFFPATLYDYEEDTQIFSIYDFSDFIKNGQLDEDNNPQYPRNKWDNMEYPLQITSYGYEMLLGYDNKPLIRSLLDNSVTRYKDPNYKNYITTDIHEGISHMTEKGRFPLSSRYRNSLYKTAPNLNDDENFRLPYWRKDSTLYSNGAQREAVTETDNEVEEGYKYEDGSAGDYQSKYGASGDCHQRSTKIPYWEAKIHRSGISPLIDETSEYADEYTPINVYLNYQYLPTSTEYHQHYFGFEGKNVKKDDGTDAGDPLTSVEVYNADGTYNKEASDTRKAQLHDYTSKIADGTYKQLTSNKTYEVLDGEGLEDINQNFGTDETTYRLIRHGNPYDHSKTMYVNHSNVFDLDLDSVKIVDNCLWEKNQCPNQKYWSYIPTGQGAAYLNVTLKAHTYYVLKYFMYIPEDAYIEDDSCYMEVQSRIDNITETIGELPQIFKDQDKKLRHQWIYHEIPFYTNEATNRVYIKGPQHNHEGIIGINRKTGEVITEISNQEINNPYIQSHDCKNDIIHFYSIQIAELMEYSPTLKYTQTGLHVVEGNKYRQKSSSEAALNTCTEDKPATNEWHTYEGISISDTWINKGTTRLPIPSTDIYIFFDNDFSIIYNQLTTELSYTKGNYPFVFDDYNSFFDETLKWESDDTEIRLEYDKLTTPYNDAQSDQYHTNNDENDTDMSQLLLAELRLFNKQRKFFTTGVNNEFTLQLQDAYGNPIIHGEVECSIWTTDKEETTPCNQSEKCLGVQTPDEYGTITYSHLNFKNFKPSRYTYYLRVVYHNPCYKKDIIKWKELYFIEEHRNMYIYANLCDKKICKTPSDCCIPQASSIIPSTNIHYIPTQDESYNILLDADKNIISDGEITHLTATTDENNNREFKYNKTSTTKNIDSVDELPLRLDVVIQNQLGNDIPEGYCELSINEKIIQTTFVDANGIADFYLDEYDLDPGIQIIKVEYFINPNESINYAYFPINCRVDWGYDEREPIPIRINTITNDVVTQLTSGIFELNKDDIFFADIDTGDKTNFSVTIQKNNETETKNVTGSLPDGYVIAAMYSNNDIDKYIITTGNLKDEYGNDINSLYRTSKKEFTVIWK